MEGRRSLSKKGKQTSASEGGEILRGKKAKQASASEGGEILMKEKGNQAGASEGDKILRTEKENQSSASTEVGEILRRKKEIWMSYEVSEDVKLLSMRLNLAQAGSGETTTKRKTKVIQKLVPEEVIKGMMKTPHPVIGELLTDDELAKHNQRFRETYAKCKVMSEKVRAYYQALIDQYLTNGRAYDEEEEEVTDDEEMVEN